MMTWPEDLTTAVPHGVKLLTLLAVAIVVRFFSTVSTARRRSAYCVSLKVLMDTVATY